ncbi:hypothetical protein [Sedimentitalea todarodis]|uniref:Uncharacterized protein n=1 Tax=Sedimentitalea todarodis TaxID=1631240 RepID=A0ABU3VH74_9RHOB|nr:hypothetical protein [Sedimentitalea todarodis]MDU9005443.1 hypothetical protein [Sedimentitalea todarodis]
MPSSLIDDIFGLFVGAAYAQEAEVWRDESTFTLAPGDSAEWKLVMEEGQTVEYRMLVDGGRVNFAIDRHDGGNSVTYEKSRGSTGDEGEQGCFWRNRDSQPATVTIQVRGEYYRIQRRKLTQGKPSA